MKNVIVFFGGESCEHDVSVITGVMALNAIDKTIYNPVPVYIGKNGKWYSHGKMNDVSMFKNVQLKSLKEVVLLPPNKSLYLIKRGRLKELCEIYSAVNCCHGGEGEGGGLYAILKSCAIPCTSAGLFASAMAMDKELTKLALKSIGVFCLSCVRINRDSFYLQREFVFETVKAKLGFPIIIKPARLGSSIGISIAKSVDELEKGLMQAFVYDSKVIVEKALVGFREINCAVYKRAGEVVVSECEEPILNSELLTFSDKYKLPTQKDFPARIDKEISEKIRKITKTIYQKLNFSGVIRIDYLLLEKEVYVNEINAVPGSLAYYLFCKTTDEFCSFLTHLIEQSVDEGRVQLQNKTTFDSGILNLSSCKTKR